jgi:hypothetical protein
LTSFYRHQVLWVLTVVILGVQMVGCEKKTAVWIIPGSNASSIQFGLGAREGNAKAGYVRTLIVQRCGTYGDNALVLWGVGSYDGLPGRITYGILPDGAQQGTAPKPLVEGLLIAFTDGTGAVHFSIDAAGSVKVIDSCYAALGES